MVRGSVWAILTRWSLRGIGLGSTVILARLLTPEDFGVAATGALTLGFIQGFSELGVQQLLIRERETSRHDFDTAWTVQMLQGAFVGALLALSAPLAGRYFGDVRAVNVVRLLALSALLGGATNIGLVIARKELNFALDFKFQTIVRVVLFLTTIGLALWLRNYWALVFANVAAAGLSVLLSFAMHPYRPRLSLVSIGKYARFATAIVPLRVGRYLTTKADVMVVGGVGGTVMLGIYNVASEFAGMVTTEILAPIGTGLLPGYAKLSHEPARYAEAFRYVLGCSATLIFPVGFGLWTVAPQVVTIVLGHQWVAAVPIVQALALYYTITGLLQVMSSQVLIASGHERGSAVAVWVRVATLVPAILLTARSGDVQTIALGAVASALVAAPFVVVILTASIMISVREVVSALVRPFLAATLMAVALHFSFPTSGEGSLASLVSLVFEVTTGAVIYFSALTALWFLQGRPGGLERTAFDFVSRKLARAVP